MQLQAFIMDEHTQCLKKHITHKYGLFVSQTAVSKETMKTLKKKKKSHFEANLYNLAEVLPFWISRLSTIQSTHLKPEHPTSQLQEPQQLGGFGSVPVFLINSAI